MHTQKTGDHDKRILFGGNRGFHRYTVYEQRLSGGTLRVLSVDGAAQSAVYINEHTGEPAESGCPAQETRDVSDRLVFSYMRMFEWAFRLNPGISRVLVLGGGGCAYPRCLLRKHPDIAVDVAESDPLVIQLARRYFGVSELEDRFPDRLRVFKADGFSFLENKKASYDLIINDAFTGRTAARSLASDGGIALVRTHLNPGGLYLVNLATAIKGPFAGRGRRSLATLRKQFEYSLLMPVHEGKPVWEPQNCVIFASEEEFRFFA